MKDFLAGMPTPALEGVQVVRFVQYIAKVLSPGRIMDFQYNGFHLGIFWVVAVVKTGRIETMAKIAQMAQQPDGPLGSLSQTFFNQVLNRSFDGYLGIAEMVSAAEIGQIDLLIGP